MECLLTVKTILQTIKTARLLINAASTPVKPTEIEENRLVTVLNSDELWLHLQCINTHRVKTIALVNWILIISF